MGVALGGLFLGVALAGVFLGEATLGTGDFLGETLRVGVAFLTVAGVLTGVFEGEGVAALAGVFLGVALAGVFAGVAAFGVAALTGDDLVDLAGDLAGLFWGVAFAGVFFADGGETTFGLVLGDAR